MPGFNYGDIIEYIDATYDPNFQDAKDWAVSHYTDFTEDISKRNQVGDVLYRYFVIGQPNLLKEEDIIAPELTEEEQIDKAKEQIYNARIDKYTLRRIRKMADHTWTEEEEDAYLRLNAEVKGYIASLFGEESDGSI